MSYVFKLLNFAFTDLLFSTTQSVFANSTMPEHITFALDDAPLFATKIIKVNSTLGTATNIKKHYQRRSNYYDDIQFNTSETDLENRELPVDLNLLGDIVPDIYYINRNRQFKF